MELETLTLHSMNIEIDHAVDFLLHFVKAPIVISEKQRKRFRKLARIQLSEKFRGHWNKLIPIKGNAYRCLSFSKHQMDPIIRNIAQETNLYDCLKLKLPSDLVLWIDPGIVSYCIGEYGTVNLIYDELNPNDTNSSTPINSRHAPHVPYALNLTHARKPTRPNKRIPIVDPASILVKVK